MLVRKLIEENVLEAKPRHYNSGDLLFVAGDAPEFVYFIISGEARLISPTGEELQLFASGSLIGLADILNEQHTHSAFFCASSEVLKINRLNLLHLIEQNPALRVYFLKLLSIGLACMQPPFE